MSNQYTTIWSDKNTEYLQTIYKDNSNLQIAKLLTSKFKINFTESSVKNKLRQMGLKAAGKKEFIRDRNDSGKSNNKVYFVTSITPNFEINKEFYSCIRQFLKHRKAELVLLPTRGINRADDFSEEVLSEFSEFMYSSFTFNSNLVAHDLRISPLSSTPLSGLNLFVQNKSSLILSHIKQDLQTIPTSKSGLPHLIQATGSLCKSNFPHNRAGILSQQNFVCGGIVVEIENDKYFHIRQVQFINHYFYDLGTKYNNYSATKGHVDGFVMGDLHVGYTDLNVLENWIDCIKLTKPRYLILHDLAEMLSISHHLDNDMTNKVNRKYPFDTLKHELDHIGEFLIHLKRKIPDVKIYVVRSNHDLFLDRWLKEQKFFNDVNNYRMGLELAQATLNGLNPLEYYMEKNYKIKDIVWLREKDDFKINGIIVSLHGHEGVGGSRGNITGISRAYSKSVSGHSHVIAIKDGAYVCGTTTRLNLPYTRSLASAWLNASVLIQNNGGRQIIVSVDNKWKL